MAAVVNGNTKRYSWWWDSHISPKNSKWLQENLTDMDRNVKQMIKVIEEDADSFARRAEMYYKKRPELMKLVEEFYRAYRALAERYDHATGVIRHAQQTMAEAFPNQDPMMFGEESPVGSSVGEFDPQTPESYPPIRAPVYPNDLPKDALGMSHMSTVKRNIAFMEDPQSVSNGKGFKIGKARKGLNFGDADEKGRNAKVLSESERASKAEAEIVALKDALSKVQAEKEANIAQFEQNLERLSNLESEVSRAQEDSKGLTERATIAEAEVETLRESLSNLEVEKESSLLQYQQCLQNIADLEDRIALAQKETGEENERASRAEAEILALKQSLVRSETDKEAALVQYQQCLETISNLEERLHKAEEDARLVSQRAENAESEVERLKQTVSKLIEENEAYELQYQQCLDTIADLKLKLFHAQEETQRLSREIEDGVAKLKFAEEKCVELENSNQNLHSELDDLLEKFGNQSHELTEKQKEMGRLWTCVQEEHLRFMEAETAFQTLQQLHSQSQEELSTLDLELQNRSQILKDMEARNNGLQEEVQEAKDQNKSLSELNLSSAASIKSLQEEVSRLRETIQKLEAEVELRVDQRNALQQEIYCLKEELSQIGKKHQSMVEQVVLVGLHPEGFGSCVKELQEENLNLKGIKERESIEKKALLEKLEMMEKLVQKNLLLENSISDLNSELETFRGKNSELEAEVELRVDQRNALQQEIYCLKEELSQIGKKHQSMVEQVELVGLHPEGFGSCVKELQEENVNLKEIKERESLEKTALLEKLEMMEKLVQKNRLLENSISDLNSELETIRGKLKTLEVACLSLAEEKSGLHSEKDMLISRLQSATENSKKLSEENRLLENSLFDANAELEELKSKLKSLEDSCHLLNDDKSSLVNERESLLARMNLMRKNIEDLEKEQAELNAKILELATERESSLQKIEELGVSLDAKDREYTSFVQLSESRMNGMESKIHHLQDENQCREREYQAELDRAHDAHIEIIVLQKCLQQWLEKSSTLIAENQNIKEASKLLEKLVSELKQENIGKQVQIESSINCIKILRTGIYQVLMKLQIIPGIDSGDENSRDQKNMHDILSRLDEMQTMLLKIRDENQQSAIENLVLVEFLRQLKSEAVSIATKKKTLEEELESRCQQLSFSQDETQKLIHSNGELTTKVNQGVNREEALKVEIEDLQQSVIANVVLVEFLRQLKSEAVGIATEKKTLEEELESQCRQLSFSQDETQKLIHSNRELTTKVNQGVDREEVLKLEIADLHRQVLQSRDDYTILKEENCKTLDEKTHLTKSTLRLEEEKRELEEDLSLLLSETMYQSNLILLLEDVVLEKLSGAVKLNKDLERLSFVKCKLEEEVREVGDKLKSAENENLQLEGLLEKSDAELLSARSANDKLEHEIANVSDQLGQKEKELLEAMLIISVVQNEKSELLKAVEDLECRYKETKAIEEDKDQQVVKLRGYFDDQVKKNDNANEANLKLENKLMNLLMELEEIKVEKEKLNHELVKERNESEVWESQAATLFGDLQISAVHETLLGGLTHELAEACKNLDKRSTFKDVEIDQLKGRVNNLEDAKKGQNDLMSKYAQAIFLLKESIESLEKHFAMPYEFENEPVKDIDSVVDNNDGFLELQEMCLRIKAIEEAVTKKLAMEALKNSSVRRSRRRNGSLRKQNQEIFYAEESEMITKDIVLDQVSDCSSYGISKQDISKIEDDHSLEVKPQHPQKGKSLSEESLVVDKLEISDRFTDPNKEVNKRKVLERLHSDLQKLSIIHTAVEDLKGKVEKEEKGEKGKEDEYETIKGQINEAEEALEKLLSINRKLVTKVQTGFEKSDGNKSSMDLDEDESTRRRRISEQARRGSEKIGRLQLEIQRLQLLLLKLEGEKEDRVKAKDSKARILLRDYIYGGVRGERRKRMKKRLAFCGCVQQPPPSP